MRKVTVLTLLAGSVILVGTTHAIADDQPRFGFVFHDDPPAVAQVVALDECDPVTFNAAVGEEGGGFCHNVTLYGLGLGFETTLDELVNAANSGTPDPGWDFEPDKLTIQKGTTVSVVDQGGEPHTFTEVAHFGGGFVPALNHGQPTAPECAGGFSNVAVARTRILQGSRLDVTSLSKGKHLFQCCIHPWMHMEVLVK
jgi:plastocyanin